MLYVIISSYPNTSISLHGLTLDYTALNPHYLSLTHSYIKCKGNSLFCRYVFPSRISVSTRIYECKKRMRVVDVILNEYSFFSHLCYSFAPCWQQRLTPVRLLIRTSSIFLNPTYELQIEFCIT